VLTLSRVIWSMSDTKIDNFLTPYIVALGGGAQVIGLINALGSLAAMFFYPVGGYIADKSARAGVQQDVEEPEDARGGHPPGDPLLLAR